MPCVTQPGGYCVDTSTGIFCDCNTGGTVGGDPGFTFEDPISEPGSVNWQSIINQGYGITSQILAAYGHHPSQQIGAGGLPIGGGYAPTQILNSAAGLSAANRPGTVGPGGVGSSLGGGVDGIIQWATANPVPVFLLIGGVFLLMRQPPGRR
jgi:hypothetical protein